MKSFSGHLKLHRSPHLSYLLRTRTEQVKFDRLHNETQIKGWFTSDKFYQLIWKLIYQDELNMFSWIYVKLNKVVWSIKTFLFDAIYSPKRNLNVIVIAFFELQERFVVFLQKSVSLLSVSTLKKLWKIYKHFILMDYFSMIQNTINNSKIFQHRRKIRNKKFLVKVSRNIRLLYSGYLVLSDLQHILLINLKHLQCCTVLE